MVQVFADKIHGIDGDRLRSALVPVLRAHGVASVEVTFQTEQGGWILRVTVESLDEPGGDLAEASPPSASEPEPRADAALDGERGFRTSAQAEGDPAGLGAVGSGIELGFLTELSRDLSTALDVADLVPRRYTLEVSSPGLERPLRSMRDFERAIGGLVKIRLIRPAADGQRVLRGRLVAVEPPEALTVEVDGKPTSARLADIERAHTVYELPAQPKNKRAPKPKSAKNLRH